MSYGKVLEVTDETFEQEVQNSTGVAPVNSLLPY
jgi:hypothetical protein